MTPTVPELVTILAHLLNKVTPSTTSILYCSINQFQ